MAIRVIIFIGTSILLVLTLTVWVSLTFSCMLSLQCTWAMTQVQTHNTLAARKFFLKTLSPIATGLPDSRFHGCANCVYFYLGQQM